MFDICFFKLQATAWLLSMNCVWPTLMPRVRERMSLMNMLRCSCICGCQRLHQSSCFQLHVIDGFFFFFLNVIDGSHITWLRILFGVIFSLITHNSIYLIWKKGFYCRLYFLFSCSLFSIDGVLKNNFWNMQLHPWSLPYCSVSLSKFDNHQWRACLSWSMPRKRWPRYIHIR